jgi:hypothetical protein
LSGSAGRTGGLFTSYMSRNRSAASGICFPPGGFGMFGFIIRFHNNARTSCMVFTYHTLFVSKMQQLNIKSFKTISKKSGCHPTAGKNFYVEKKKIILH